MKFDNEFDGVQYYLSATILGGGQWQGEAHARVKQGGVYAHFNIATLDDHPSEERARLAAEEQLRAACASGALFKMEPVRFELIK